MYSTIHSWTLHPCNYIKSLPLCTHLFRALCDEMGAKHRGFLFYLNIRLTITRKGAVELLAYASGSQTFLHGGTVSRL